jgi:hypothetical protein
VKAAAILPPIRLDAFMRTQNVNELQFRTDFELRLLPRNKQLADKLADALLAIDDALFVTGSDGAEHLRAFDETLRGMWEALNDMMKQITD